jgi:hypothetical protein
MSDVPGWTFDITEVSFGHYRIRGYGPGGMTVERHTSKPEEALLEAKADAAELSKRIGLSNT